MSDSKKQQTVIQGTIFDFPMEQLREKIKKKQEEIRLYNSEIKSCEEFVPRDGFYEDSKDNEEDKKEAQEKRNRAWEELDALNAEIQNLLGYEKTVKETKDLLYIMRHPNTK